MHLQQCKQFILANGLRQKIADTTFDREPPVPIHRACSKGDDDRIASFRMGPNHARRLQSVDNGHPHIHQDRVRSPLFPCEDGLTSVFCFPHSETYQDQHFLEPTAIELVIVDNEYSRSIRTWLEPRHAPAFRWL